MSVMKSKDHNYVFKRHTNDECSKIKKERGKKPNIRQRVNYVSVFYFKDSPTLNFRTT